MVGIVIARFVLVVFNSVLFAFGIVIFVFGITVFGNNYTVIENAEPNYIYALRVVSVPDVNGNIAIFMVTAGVVSVTFSILGCCASATFRKHSLLLYWTILLILTLFEIVVVIFVAVYPEQRRTQIQKKTYESLKDHFKPVSKLQSMSWNDLEDARSGDPVADSWLMMEIRFHCCGANDYLDYQTFSWNNIIEFLDQKLSASVPVQCCKHVSSGPLGSSANITRCLAAEPRHINTEGCFEVIMNALRVFGNYVIGLVASSIGIQVILLSAAIYLWSKF